MKEPSAADRARQADRQTAQQQRPPRHRSRRGLLLLSAAIVLATVGAGAYAYHDRKPAPAAAPPAPSAPPVSSASSAPAPAASGGPGAVIPLSVFPEKVQGYTLVADAADSDCTGADLVTPTLAGLITQAHGCLGIDLALYRDAAGNQYRLALFTMKDPTTLPHLVNQLAVDATHYQVAVQLPPRDSGLRELPPESGFVQDFVSYGTGMLIGMAQWSDGRTGDFNELVKQLSPLTDAVIRNVPV
ncbi:hypothetical protein ACWEPB_05975 [Kitasatospora cineracea]|uniref:hypothetical protein n=1 Tax=Kitasatospora cineracea TaxID=88074 RepID=UPI0033D83863